jgi:hypothetical protein
MAEEVRLLWLCQSCNWRGLRRWLSNNFSLSANFCESFFRHKKSRFEAAFLMAEEVRFELTEELPPRQFSRLI